jgi:hypothetical protein
MLGTVCRILFFNPSSGIEDMPPGFKKAQVSDGVFFVALPAGSVKQMKTPLEIEIVSDGERVGEIKTTFIGPVFKHQEGIQDSTVNRQ